MRLAHRWLVLVGAAVPTAQLFAALPPGIPPALAAAAAARSVDRLQTSRMNILIHDRTADGEATSHHYEWYAAGEQRRASNYGDQDGVCVRPGPGSRGEIAYPGPFHALTHEGETWLHAQNDPLTRVWASDSAAGVTMREFMNLVDFRKIGVAPSGIDDDWLADVARHGMPEPEWSQQPDGVLVRVTARLPGHGAFEWWIDPLRDHSVVRTRVELLGRIIGEREFSLKEVDGVWFPARVDVYRYGDGGTRADGPSRVIEFLGVEWNRPEHPREFHPSDIGVEPGARISAQDPGVSSGTWNGERVVDALEFLLDVRAGRAHWGPTVAHEMRARGAVLQTADVPGESSDEPPTAGNANGGESDTDGRGRPAARDAHPPAADPPTGALTDHAQDGEPARVDTSGRNSASRRTIPAVRLLPLSFNASNNRVWHVVRERAPDLYRRAWLRPLMSKRR